MPARPQRIRPGEKVALRLNDRQRELILDSFFVDGEISDRLIVAPAPGEEPDYFYSLAELEELAGHVAAQANHETKKKLRAELDELYDVIDQVIEQYVEEDPVN
jgi:hypothetical protein